MSMFTVPCPPSGAVDCELDVQIATATIFYVRNKKKHRNFVMADITSAGYFHYYLENLPKNKLGGPGWWLFQLAWDYFIQELKIVIKGIRGDWTSGDNLDTVNRLTAGGLMTLDQAAKQTWGFQQAVQKGFSHYQYLDAQGSAGKYTSVDVVFLP